VASSERTLQKIKHNTISDTLGCYKALASYSAIALVYETCQFYAAFLKIICRLYKHEICGRNAEITALYILWSELSWRKLLLTLASAHYSCPDNATGLIGRQLGGNFLTTANVYVDQIKHYAQSS